MPIINAEVFMKKIPEHKIFRRNGRLAVALLLGAVLFSSAVFFHACMSTGTAGYSTIRDFRNAFLVGDRVSVVGGNYSQSTGTVIGVDMDSDSYRVRLVNKTDPVIIRSTFLKKINDIGAQEGGQYPPTPNVTRTPVVAPVTPYASGSARMAVLPIVGLDEDTAETLAWHIANQDAVHKNFNIVPITPVIRKNVLTEQSYDSFFNAGEDVHSDYILASFARTVGYEKIFFTLILDVHTKQQLAGDYRKYSDYQQLTSFFPSMTRKMVTVFNARKTDAPKLSVEVMAFPAKGVSPNDAIVLTQLLAINVANTNVYNVFPRTENIDAAMLEYETRRTTAKKVFIDKSDITASELVLSSKIALFGGQNQVLAEIITLQNDVLKRGAHINFINIEDTPELLNKLAFSVTGMTRPQT
jgi:hypothetical protein